ncbi:MAG TPA: hypothetical protein PKE45_05495 [Caldilineaceae bacterium]|nr:hypothetical protein [Caldilineaceae bacterium]
MSSLAETKATSVLYRPPAPSAVARAIGGIGYDWSMVLLSLVFVGGLYLDGWAHNHDQVDDSFFTPWHAFFYGGFGLIALLLLATLVINRVRGYPWRRALPAGYLLSLLGVLIFAVGGVGDLLWHELFGIEQDFEALLSPTHLTLVLGLGLIVSGPLRAAWQRAGRRPSWRTLGPALLSLTALISALTFILMYTHPVVPTTAGLHHHEYNSEMGHVAGVLGMVITAMLLMGPTMLVMRRWTLPGGSLMLVWGLNLTAMTIVNYQHSYTIYQYGVMLGAIALIDLLRVQLQPSIRNTGGWRVFAFIAPVLYIGAYVVALLLTEGSNWSVHMLSGSVVLAGVASWLLSYMLIPPRMPAE